MGISWLRMGISVVKNEDVGGSIVMGPKSWMVWKVKNRESANG